VNEIGRMDAVIHNAGVFLEPSRSATADGHATTLAVNTLAPAATVSGGYWYHRERQEPAAQARDPAFQDQLMDRLAALTGVALL
jgi:NAD(P)-dependent dehydrogenase (short-subunit alcohol dehydrogenase family)